ncbi:hypothetical protein [Deinococcus radiotolerans]|uniref:hypothetical protein n=1 Tax=Deinococcus radiotolerans TaxID=1309407 RepID=UPI001665405E|nr:hypothetical protein [Deinococcus radiotolerans]
MAPITLDSDAIAAFELTTDVQLFYGIIGIGEYINRLDFLDELIEGMPEDGSGEEVVRVESLREGEFAPRSGGSTPIPRLELTVRTPGMSIKKWKFHKGDDDPNPSIPHGHSDSDDRIKLDAYQGYVYKKSEQLGRVSRNSIVVLWNDKEFRKFAREAINAYIDRNGDFHFKDYRRALPKRQKR